MKYHENLLLSDALYTAIQSEKRNIRLKRFMVLEGILCILVGILIGWLL